VLTGNAVALTNRLITEQDNRTWSLISVITEWRLFILRAFAVAVSLRVWRARNRGEWDALPFGAMLPQVARDRLRRCGASRETGRRHHSERCATARLQRHRTTNECGERTDQRI
jgi:hypothetical protein